MNETDLNLQEAGDRFRGALNGPRPAIGSIQAAAGRKNRAAMLSTLGLAGLIVGGIVVGAGGQTDSVTQTATSAEADEQDTDVTSPALNEANDDSATDDVDGSDVDTDGETDGSASAVVQENAASEEVSTPQPDGVNVVNPSAAAPASASPAASSADYSSAVSGDTDVAAAPGSSTSEVTQGEPAESPQGDDVVIVDDPDGAESSDPAPDGDDLEDLYGPKDTLTFSNGESLEVYGDPDEGVYFLADGGTVQPIALDQRGKHYRYESLALVEAGFFKNCSIIDDWMVCRGADSGWSPPAGTDWSWSDYFPWEADPAGYVDVDGGGYILSITEDLETTPAQAQQRIDSGEFDGCFIDEDYLVCPGANSAVEPTDGFFWAGVYNDLYTGPMVYDEETGTWVEDQSWKGDVEEDDGVYYDESLCTWVIPGVENPNMCDAVQVDELDTSAEDAVAVSDDVSEEEPWEEEGLYYDEERCMWLVPGEEDLFPLDEGVDYCEESEDTGDPDAEQIGELTSLDNGGFKEYIGSAENDAEHRDFVERQVAAGWWPGCAIEGDYVVCNGPDAGWNPPEDSSWVDLYPEEFTDEGESDGEAYPPSMD